MNPTTPLMRLIERLERVSKIEIIWDAINVATLAFAIVLSYLVRFEGVLTGQEWASLGRALGTVVPIQFAMLFLVAGRRTSIRGVTLRDLWQLVFGVSAGLAVAAPVGMVAGLSIPRSIYIIDWFIAISLLGGLRGAACEAGNFLRRWSIQQATRVLLVGTCPSSEAVARSLRMQSGSQGQRVVVGIVAKAADAALVGRSIGGVAVLGTTASIEQLIARHRIDEVLMLSDTLIGGEVRDLRERCKAVDCPTAILPAFETILSGRVKMQPRPVDIADLLRREPVKIDIEGIGRWLGNETVLVTGACGSIGSELCRQLLKHGPARLVLLDRNETGLFWLERELMRLGQGTGTELIPCVADITDRDRLDDVMAEHTPGVVFHAAAYKHVPLMEQYPGEAVKNITLATAGLAEAAAAAGVQAFVLISTDKAVNPTSVMGCCKRLAEIVVKLLSQESATRFSTVRFGNVLDSAGSVVPIFREQILQGGPVTVTHPDIERYFMTIPEAARLVIQAGMMGTGGEVFVLDMGEPVRIADLARDMIRLSNLEEGRDIEIRFTGLRPGEKLYEELFKGEEALQKTRHPKIQAAKLTFAAGMTAETVLDQMRAAATLPPDDVRAVLHALVPEYMGHETELPQDAIAGRVAPARRAA
jgi:FlaA1/EpsC-like NDP-sugar epimerase